MTLIEFLLTACLLWCMGCLVWPAWKRRVAAANRRACFVLQQSIEVAINQYNEANPSTPIRDLASTNFNLLVDKQLLEGVPNDPGEGNDSWQNYRLRDGKVVCTVHGAAPARSPESGDGAPASKPATESTTEG